MSTKTIPIDIAKEWAHNWQSANPNHCKAFLIPSGDLISAFEEMGVIVSDGDGKYTINELAGSGVRAYMAINPAVEEGYGEKLLIVGTELTDGTNRDIIQDEKGAAANSKMIGSGVFDFTKPCPNDCDEDSPLFNP